MYKCNDEYKFDASKVKPCWGVHTRDSVKNWIELPTQYFSKTLTKPIDWTYFTQIETKLNWTFSFSFNFYPNLKNVYIDSKKGRQMKKQLIGEKRKEKWMNLYKPQAKLDL